MNVLASGGSLIVPALPDLVWGTVCFLIVAIAVQRFAWPTFIQTLDERTRRIDDGLNAAARAQKEIAAERAKLTGEIDDARREAAGIREKAQANAAAIIEDAKKAATVEASRVSANAKRQIAADAEIAKAQLRNDVGTLATELAGRIVGEQALDENISNRVIDSFLNELEESAAVGVSVTEEN